MWNPKTMPANLTKLLVAATLLLAGLTGCSVNVKDDKGGSGSKVDVQTPFASVHVRERANPKDIGLRVYPGARLSKGDGDSGVGMSIDAPGIGLTIAVASYESDDPPGKVLDFYRQELKTFGDVSECHGHIGFGDHDMSGEIKCHPGSGDKTELGAGKASRHRIVSVEPRGKGSKFDLVYIQMGESKETI